LREHFHLPLHTVALKFGMCTTAFKKMCRRMGIAKWPHRQLRGIDKKIAALKAELTYASNGDKKQFLMGLHNLEEEKSRLASGLMGDLFGDCSNASASQDEDDGDSNSKETPPPTPSPSFNGGDSSLHKAASSSHAHRDSDEEEEEEEDGSSSSNDDANAPSGANIIVSEKELRQNFHLPLHSAARKFGICTTAFKKLCRRFGIAKWPHRQLRGIDKKIAALKAELNYTTGDKFNCWKSLQALEDEKARLSCSDSGASASPALTSESSKKRSRGSYEESTPGAQGKASRAKKQTSTEPSVVVAGVVGEAGEGVVEEEEQGEMVEEGDSPGEGVAAGDRNSDCFSSSALDVLAAVCGGFACEIKREVESNRAGAAEQGLPQDEAKLEVAAEQPSSSSSSSSSSSVQGSLDTPPMQPSKPFPSLQPFHEIKCVSPINSKRDVKEAGMIPNSETHLVGFSWTGQLDQCA